MPKRDDIKKIMIIGSGPIIIGQACEFDYSGTQACQALKGLGYEVVLVNSNPATIMTDPEMADATYIEPLNKGRLTEIIAKERPCALLPSCGGQTALNLAMELDKAGVFKEYGVEVIGVNLEAIERGEDRIAFKEMMDTLGIEMAKSAPAYTVEEAVGIAGKLGYPCVVRPAYTMGGTGGGICYTKEELIEIASRGIAASMINQVLVEESILGWEELELEIVRDISGHMITICFIENLDPMGVHTGDSICCAPMLDVPQHVMERLQESSYKIVDSIGVIGGCNCQFAYNPQDGRIAVIEINPRTSRSSALASKATGFPIARVSAQLAAGFTLSELPYWREGTLDKYTPCGDHIVIKFPRWAFEKFPKAKDILGTQMKAVGEVMSIGKNLKEALQKAVRSLETGRMGLGFAKDFNELPLADLLKLLERPSGERFFILYEALRKGATVQQLNKLTSIKPFFLNQIKEMVDLEEELIAYKGRELPLQLLAQAKKDGFADKYIAMLLEISEQEVAKMRQAAGVTKSWDAITVSGADAAYYYSYYNGALPQTPPLHWAKPSPASPGAQSPLAPEADSSNRKRVLILGGGPNRIGQGIEFDYCCVHATFALRKLGIETVMINCNPETVSTDYDTADRLYFEPLTVEDVLAIVEIEKPLGVVVQFGGQTPLNIAHQLKTLGVPILGTSPEIINTAEDRDLFRGMMDKLGIPMPESGMASTAAQAMAIAANIGYPLIVRPSYVLGGQGMEIVHSNEALTAYMENAIKTYGKNMPPILIDRFLNRALECEADAIADGVNVFVPAIIEHIERTGVHSGDSACVIPPVSIPAHHQETIRNYTQKIAQELGVIGLMNIQYAIEGEKIYVLEANPRASRTVPLVSKVCNVQMAQLAMNMMIKAATGQGDIDLTKMTPSAPKVYGVKESVFPFNMFQEVDPVLGPEMRSTGEVLGLASSFEMAFSLAQEGAKAPLPNSGMVLLSVSEAYMDALPAIARDFQGLGFTIVATENTFAALKNAGIAATQLKHILSENQPISDLIMNGTIDFVLNTPGGSLFEDGSRYSAGMGQNIRRAAVRKSIPMFTTIDGAKVVLKAIKARRVAPPGVSSLQEYSK
ncbi:MAG: carbamoyl-phosphate synthase large subunit [Defluviitaleaceae bacterium]|nr:carbamoyl-phosphate synthase large subunit [Defluviitaleaceae bacterium]